MFGLDRVKRLGRDLAGALAEIDRLKAVEAIRACISNVRRALDRVDEELLRPAFYPGGWPMGPTPWLSDFATLAAIAGLSAPASKVHMEVGNG